MDRRRLESSHESKSLFQILFTIQVLVLTILQVYLPAIAGHVPPQMVRAISSFMEFCYLVRRSILDDDDLDAIDGAVADFHRDRVAFNEIRPDGYSLPRQHSIVHYRFLVQEYLVPQTGSVRP